jgi:DNA-binding IclR family transcriptional regulator
MKPEPHATEQRRHSAADTFQTPTLNAPEGTQSIVRSIRLLKAVTRSRAPRSLDDLSEELGLSKPTAHRILSALVSEGMVYQDPGTRCFTPGRESLAMSANSIRHYDLRSVARPVLEKIALLSGETATLEIPIQTDVLILDEVSSSNLVGARAEIGTRWPMYATSSGKVILSTLGPVALNTFLSRDRVALTPRTIISENELRATIEQAKRDGYASAEGELQPSFNAVSAVITDHLGVAVAALSIGGPGGRLSRTRMDQLGVLVRTEAAFLETVLTP